MTNFWTVVYFHIIMTLLLLLVVHQLCFPVYIWGWRRRSLWPVVGMVGCRTWRFWALSLWKLQMKKMAGFPYSSTTMTRREPNYRCVRDNTACRGLSMYFEGKVVDRLVFLEKNTAPSVTFRLSKIFCLARVTHIVLFILQTHPHVDKKLFTNESLICLKNQDKSFPLNTDLGVLKWRIQSTDESLIPLTSESWHTSAWRFNE